MSTWDDIKPWVSKLAPYLGAAVGGPFGAGVGAIIGNALGVKDASPDSIAQAIKTGTLDADHILALQQAEKDFALKMQAAGFANAEALEEIAFKDRDSARNREIQVKDHTPAIGFYMITAGFFGLLVMMLFHAVPEVNKAVLYVMTGSLGTAWMGCTTYFYGTTRTSGIKDQMLFNSTPTDGVKV